METLDRNKKVSEPPKNGVEAALNRSIRVNNENSIAGLSNVKNAESDNSANSRCKSPRMMSKGGRNSR